uniref:Putative secreted protein n=1 Tax=Anopheles triannulatus TaxID=58253 RepID=A0A2M4B6I1_9DIPT
MWPWPSFFSCWPRTIFIQLGCQAMHIDAVAYCRQFWLVACSKNTHTYTRFTCSSHHDVAMAQGAISLPNATPNKFERTEYNQWDLVCLSSPFVLGWIAIRADGPCSSTGLYY